MTELTAEKLVERLKLAIEAAEDCISALNNGHRRWRMSIPVQPDDTDMVFANLCNRAEEAHSALIKAAEERENLLDEYIRAPRYPYINATCHECHEVHLQPRVLSTTRCRFCTEKALRKRADAAERDLAEIDMLFHHQYKKLGNRIDVVSRLERDARVLRAVQERAEAAKQYARDGRFDAPMAETVLLWIKEAREQEERSDAG